MRFGGAPHPFLFPLSFSHNTLKLLPCFLIFIFAHSPIPGNEFWFERMNAVVQLLLGFIPPPPAVHLSHTPLLSTPCQSGLSAIFPPFRNQLFCFKILRGSPFSLPFVSNLCMVIMLIPSLFLPKNGLRPSTNASLCRMPSPLTLYLTTNIQPFLCRLGWDHTEC